MQQRLLRFLALISLAAASIAEAQIYRWVDEDGNVHFGDRRPPQVAESIEMDTETNRESAAEARARNKEIEDALSIVTDSRVHRETVRQEHADAEAKHRQQVAECQQITKFRQRLAAGGLCLLVLPHHRAGRFGRRCNCQFRSGSGWYTG